MRSLAATWKRVGFWLAGRSWFKRFVAPQVLTRIDRFLITKTGRSLTAPGTSPEGLPMLNLTAVGARSGEPRTVPLAYLERGGLFYVVASNWGRAEHPGWSANLLAHPKATIKSSVWEGPVHAEQLDPDAIQKLWPDLIAHLPNWETYRQELESRDIRVFRLRAIIV